MARCGGALGLVPGFLVFRPSIGGGVDRPGRGERSPRRVSAVGWPRVDGSGGSIGPSALGHATARAEAHQPSGRNGTGRVRTNDTFDDRTTGHSPGDVSRETARGRAGVPVAPPSVGSDAAPEG